MRAGVCFVAPKGSRFDPGGHLWIVFLGPVVVAGEDQVLMTSLTSCTGHNDDPTCLVRPGEHPFVRHDSFIAFVRTKLVRATAMSHAIAGGALIGQPDASSALVSKIQRAALVSPHVRKADQALLRSAGVRP